MNNGYFLIIDQLNELLKSYYIYRGFDENGANAILDQINAIRLKIALEAEQRQNFWKQINIPSTASGYKQDYFYHSEDIASVLCRGIGSLEQNVQLSLTHQGLRQNVVTREGVGWQEVFSDVQGGNNGQELLFDLPQELYFEKNQSLDIGVIGQSSDDPGFIFLHGCNLKDDYSPNVEQIKAEILTPLENGLPNLPQPQLVPLQFTFPTATVDTYATDPAGNKEIFSLRSEKSVILTEISTNATLSRVESFIDNGRNQSWCNLVEMAGIASDYTNKYTTYYPLPYPHLLRKNDRLSVRILNGSDITSSVQSASENNFIVLRGFTI